MTPPSLIRLNKLQTAAARFRSESNSEARRAKELPCFNFLVNPDVSDTRRLALIFIWPTSLPPICLQAGPIGPLVLCVAWDHEITPQMRRASLSQHYFPWTGDSAVAVHDADYFKIIQSFEDVYLAMKNRHD
jgi:hypothetical protein